MTWLISCSPASKITTTNNLEAFQTTDVFNLLPSKQYNNNNQKINSPDFYIYSPLARELEFAQEAYCKVTGRRGRSRTQKHGELVMFIRMKISK